MQPLLHWKSIKYYICWESVCSLSYLACSMRAPYCHLQPALLCSIFLHYLINSKVLEKTLLSAKCMFWFPLQLFFEIFLILRRNERDMIKKYHMVVTYSTVQYSTVQYSTVRYCCTVLYCTVPYCTVPYHTVPYRTIKYPLFLTDFNETWIFLMVFWKIFKYQVSWKSVHWEPSCSVQTDGQTWQSL